MSSLVDGTGIIDFSQLIACMKATGEAGEQATLGVKTKMLLSWAKNWALDKAWKELLNSGAIAYKAGLQNFLNELAERTAVKLASGGRGQSPLVEARPMKDIIFDAADNAAGLMIQELGQSGMFGEKFNLCEPDFSIKYKIILGLQEQYHPVRKAECTFSTMLKNWDKELKNPDFLPKFQGMFRPDSNDLGIALSVQTNIITEINKEINAESLTAVKNEGFKDMTDTIGNWVRTPATMIKTMAGITAEEADKNLFVYTGSAAADAVGVFTTTLMGRLIDKWLNPSIGMNTSAPARSNIWDLNDPYGQASKDGIAGAKERYKNLKEPNFSIRGDYNILGELTTCSDPTKAGPTNCVITENFRQAIENRMTVGQAMKEGYLNPSGIFGFTSDGLEPPYNEGYPYRSMPILRKFRIIPVGWEIAAEYIKNYSDKTYNLGDLVACFDSSDDYAGLDESWCHGLVDPSWVLKAPLNYCKREGAGPEIISDQVMGEGYNSQRVIARNDNYCGDEQSCIKENDDGSCQLYGYCTEERRKWQLNAKSCEPKYNTCQTFKSEAGNTISYLENTLDYGNCNADNAGCKAYCADYDFTNGKWTCTASTGDKIHLDKNAEECDEESEGCSEVIRTKAGVGANLIKNSSFENYTGTVDDAAGDTFDQWGGIGEAVSDSFDAGTAVKMSGSLTKAVEAAPADFVIAGEIFSFSFYAKNCAEGDTYNIEGGEEQELNGAADWMPYQTTYAFPKDAGGNSVTIKINSSSCVVDAIKLERGRPNSYTDYRGAGLEYLKIAPDYLNCDGNSDPAECNNFARKCSAYEVGCELYTSVSDKSSIPANALAQDYCSAECAGYDGYIQGASAFDSLRNSYFIPKTAKTCGSSAAGCDQFTNLDEVEKGGEGVEYYSNLRQCVRIGDAGADCGEFYTWEGSDETGFQLKVHQLEKNGAEPEVTEDDSAECDEDIYSLSPADPAYNPDCREFYNKTGDVYYHLYTRTKTCSDNCHPYRRSENNIDPDLADPASCGAAGSGYAGTEDSQFHWDGAAGECVYCKNGGEWNGEQNACVYMAIPGEGTRCSAGENGYREYRGNSGNNVKVISMSDFEGSLQNWAGVGTAVDLSNTALINGGNSMFVKEIGVNVLGERIAALKIGEAAKQGNTYAISFIAKSAGGGKINSIKLANGSGGETLFSAGGIALRADWNLYEANLPNLDHKPDADEILVIAGDGAFYIDDIKLKEITDVYYLIKNSWTTPDSCYYDQQGNYVGPYFNAGCEEYKDRDNNTHYLHQFSRLCGDSAVGCEIMISTRNSSDYGSKTFNSGDPSEITVPADSYNYIVYDKKKKCGQEDKGCSKLGKPSPYGNTVLYSDVYLKNNPDKYDLIMCKADEVYCGEWTSVEGNVYFKDPGNTLCEWRQKAGQASESWGWYKIKVKRCDSNKDGQIKVGETAVCLSEGDCASGISCIMDENDYACPTSNSKTLGIGGSGNAVLQPKIENGVNWAGLCPAAQSGCTEFIEPVSSFSPNFIFNSDFSQNVDGNTIADGWSAAVNGVQDIKLSGNTLYVLSVEGDNTITLDAHDSLFELGSNNVLNGGTSQIVVSSDADKRTSKLFYTGSPVSGRLTTENALAGNGAAIGLKKVILDYKLKQDLDESSCNGVVNFEQGCVLFNKRAQNGKNLEIMKWDADSTADDGTPESGIEAERDSNIILKASPDRICGKWLACRSYIKDENGNNICFDIGTCDSVDNNGSCSSFVTVEKNNQTYPGNSEKISNMAGYVKAGIDWGESKRIEGYYPAGVMEQEGQIANVSNGGFEFYGSNGYPIGWKYVGGTSWNENVFSVINNPYSAQTEGIGSAPEGSSFLKYSPSSGTMESEFIDVEPGNEYVLSAYMNSINFHPSTGFDSVAAGIYVATYDASGKPVGQQGGSRDIFRCGIVNMPWMNGCGFNLNGGSNWQKLSVNFTLGSGTYKIKLYTMGSLWWGGGVKCCDKVLGDEACPNVSAGDFNYYPSGSCTFTGDVNFTPADLWGCQGADTFPKTISKDSCSGNVYFDDIKIKPALNHKQNDNIGQTCRLYPESDSLSCEYYDDSGMLKKGWSGYCLEYDRYPGSSDACILWWPTDKVKGEGVEEGAGYLGKIPVYYCAEAQSLIVLEKRRFIANGVTVGCDWGGEINPPATYAVVGGGVACEDGGCGNSSDCEGSDTLFYSGYKPVGTCIYDCKDDGTGWYASDGLNYFNSEHCACGASDSACPAHHCKPENEINEKQDGVKFYNPDTGEVFDDIAAYCAKVVKTVNDVGDNKYWSGRVYAGSDYKIDDLNYIYTTDGEPFGSIIPPAPTSNPYEWDGNSAKDGFQPLYVRNDGVRASHPYKINNNNGVGAYGICELSGAVCFHVNGISYDKNKGDCKDGDTCQIINFSNNPIEKISRIFAQSYGVYNWNAEDKRYQQTEGDWPPPTTKCDSEPRPAYPNDLCGIPPKIKNLAVNNQTGNIIIINNQFINLTFNTEVDSQQLPLTMYGIDWGDNEKTTVTGVEMRDRSNPANPHSLYHLYSYWDLKAKNATKQDNNSVYCGDADAAAENYTNNASGLSCPAESNCCMIKPKAKVQDNWGWCQDGVSNNPCQEGYQSYGGWIVVREK